MPRLRLELLLPTDWPHRVALELDGAGEDDDPLDPDEAHDELRDLVADLLEQEYLGVIDTFEVIE